MALTLKVDDKFKAFMQSGSLPEVSSTDNGDVLTVVEGAWAKSAPILPAVSAEDDGDVLTVVEGAWAKAAPSGGGSSGLVVTQDSSSALNKTWSEINTAMRAGNAVVITFDGEDNGVVMRVDEVTWGSGEYIVKAGLTTYTTNSESGYPAGNSNED